MGLSCKPSELGLSPEGSGEVQGKGVTWPGLCFRTISVAAVKWLEVSRVGVALLGETEESFRWEMLGFSVKGTNNVGRKTSNK